MISAAQILAVLLVAVCVVMVFYWFRQRRSSSGTPHIETGGGQSEVGTPSSAGRNASTVAGQENAEPKVHDPKDAAPDLGGLETRAVSVDDERHMQDETANEKVYGGERRPDDSRTSVSVDEHSYPCSPPSASGANTGIHGDTSARPDSQRGGQVARRSHPPTSDEEGSAPNFTTPQIEQASLAATGQPAVDSNDETPVDEKAAETVPSEVQLGEANADRTRTTPPKTRRQLQNETRQEPRRYEGLTRRAPGPRSNSRNEPNAAPPNSGRRERSLSIEVRLRFERGGSCVVSIIPSRSPGAPADPIVASASGPLELQAMQDEWYQDIVPENIGQILCEGAIWSQVDGSGKWSLSGRELYVLGERLDLSGWVSQPCLKLGRKHVILCTEQVLPAAEHALCETGAENSVALDASFGSPAGWVVIRDVVPVRSVSPSDQADILNALRPLPQLEICLEDGIRLEYSKWLGGYPPIIRVYGYPDHTPEVRIDGSTAFCGDDGGYRVPAWDAIGAHTVWCAGMSKSYSIVPFEASWDWWDAYTFPVAPGSVHCISICGPLVRDASGSHHDWKAAIQVPETSSVIIGAAPGEHTLAIRASEVLGMPCFASPSFCPVWALPRNPLRCSKQTTRVVFLGEYREPISTLASRPVVQRHPGTDTWTRVILDANRKGLAVEPDSERVRRLWRLYTRVARNIWRSIR